MTDLRDSLAQVVELLGRATPGEWRSHDAPRGYITTITAGETSVAFATNEAASIEQQNDDANAIAAAVNFLRTHGPALLAMMEDHSPDAGKMGEDSARLDWLCSGRQKKVERTLSDGWFRVYQDMASIMDPEDWHAMTDQFYETTRAAIDAARAGERGVS